MMRLQPMTWQKPAGCRPAGGAVGHAAVGTTETTWPPAAGEGPPVAGEASPAPWEGAGGGAREAGAQPPSDRVPSRAKLLLADRESCARQGRPSTHHTFEGGEGRTARAGPVHWQVSSIGGPPQCHPFHQQSE